MKIRWRDASVRMTEGKDSSYKIFWVENENGAGDVGVVLSKERIEKVFNINRVSHRIMMIKLAIDNMIITLLSRYASQVALDNVVTNTFYDQPQDTDRKERVGGTLVMWGFKWPYW